MRPAVIVPAAMITCAGNKARRGGGLKRSWEQKSVLLGILWSLPETQTTLRQKIAFHHILCSSKLLSKLLERGQYYYYYYYYIGNNFSAVLRVRNIFSLNFLGYLLVFVPDYRQLQNGEKYEGIKFK